METRNKIVNFLHRFVGDASFSDTDDIFKLGLVNSLFAMQLVSYIESEFGVILENSDLDRDNFRNVESIVSLIHSKK